MTKLASIDSAWAASAAILVAAADGEPGAPAVRRLLEAHATLEARRMQMEAGNTLAILHGIAECAHNDLPIPEWLRAAFTQRLAAFVRPGGPPTLDDVFSSPHLRRGRKRRRLDRDRWELGLRLWSAVRAIEGEHSSLDSALTAVLAPENWGVRKTQARGLVQRIDDSQRKLTGGRDCLRFRT